MTEAPGKHGHIKTSNYCWKNIRSHAHKRKLLWLCLEEGLLWDKHINHRDIFQKSPDLGPFHKDNYCYWDSSSVPRINVIRKRLLISFTIMEIIAIDDCYVSRHVIRRAVIKKELLKALHLWGSNIYWLAWNMRFLFCAAVDIPQLVKNLLGIILHWELYQCF